MSRHGKQLSAMLLAAAVAAAGVACSQETVAAARPDWQSRLDHRLREVLVPPPAARAFTPVPPLRDADGRLLVVVTLTQVPDTARMQALHDSGFLDDIISADRLQLQGRIAAAGLQALASLPFVRWIAPLQQPVHK